MGICGCMFIVFLVLKLLGKITWSWLWVTGPLWVWLIVVIIYYFIVFFFGKEK